MSSFGGGERRFLDVSMLLRFNSVESTMLGIAQANLALLSLKRAFGRHDAERVKKTVMSSAVKKQRSTESNNIRRP